MECSNCHYQNTPGTKFCVKCGNKLSESDVTERVATDTHKVEEHLNEGTKEVSKNAHDFFEFFKDSLKKPMSMNLPSDKKLGYISIVVYLILGWLTIYSFGKKITDSVGQMVGMSVSSSPVSGQVTNNLGFAVILSLAVTWIIGWAVSSLIMNNKVSLADYTMEYSRFINVGSVIFILSIILIFICPINLFYLGLGVFAIGCTMSTFALTYTILTAKNNGSFDSLYALLIAYTLGMVVTSLVLQSIIGNLITSLFKMF